MKKEAFAILSVGVAAVSLVVLLFQGFALPSISAPMALLLRILAAAGIQLFFLLMFRRFLRYLPLLLTVLLALWGGWLFCSSPSWQNATFLGYLADYCSLAFACGLTIFLEHKLS